MKLSESQKNARNLLYKDDTRILVLNWSRQCGKTRLCETVLIEYLLKPKTKNIYVSPTFVLGRKVYKEITEVLERCCPQFIKSCNASTLTIEMVNGSALQFFSMESYNSLRGQTVKRGLLICDEASFYPDEFADGSVPWGNSLFPLVKKFYKENKVIMVSTPSGCRGMFYEFAQKGLQGKNGIAYIKANLYDDGFVTPDEIEEIRDTVPELAFRQEFLCEFLEDGGSFFQQYQDCFKPFIFRQTLQNWVGIDFSGNGTDDTIFTRINENNEVYQEVVSGTLDQKYARLANLINETKGLVCAYLENNGLGSPMINEVKKLVNANSRQKIKEWNTTNANKLDMLSELATDISKKELNFQESDNQLRSQFKTFKIAYTKKGNIQLNAQSGHKDDRIMSLGLANKARHDSTFVGNYSLSFMRKGR